MAAAISHLQIGQFCDLGLLLLDSLLCLVPPIENRLQLRVVIVLGTIMAVGVILVLLLLRTRLPRHVGKLSPALSVSLLLPCLHLVLRVGSCLIHDLLFELRLDTEKVGELLLLGEQALQHLLHPFFWGLPGVFLWLVLALVRLLSLVHILLELVILPISFRLLDRSTQTHKLLLLSLKLQEPLCLGLWVVSVGFILAAVQLVQILVLLGDLVDCSTHLHQLLRTAPSG